MSRTPNFETIVMSSILLEAYFREHSIYMLPLSQSDVKWPRYQQLRLIPKYRELTINASVCIPKTMSTTPNFETSYSCPTLLEAYFSEHSINVTIVPIGCQMAEISVKDGLIVIKKSYGDFCSYVVPSLIKFTWSSIRNPQRRGWAVW